MNLLHAAPPEYVGIYLSKALLFAAISMKTIRDRLDTPSFTLCYHYNTDEFMKRVTDDQSSFRGRISVPWVAMLSSTDNWFVPTSAINSVWSSK